MKAPLIALVLAAAVPTTAAGQTLSLSASKARAGRIDLAVEDVPGTPVSLSEGDRPVGDVTVGADGTATYRDAGEWSCVRHRRTFTAQSPSETATATVRTPGCAHRYALVVAPRRPRAGHRVKVRIVDRFHLGDVHARVCAHGPVTVCRRAPARLQLGSGRWRITAHHARARIRVRPPRHLRLLATGDSMIQIIDSFLKQRLEPRATVRSDAHISSGLSKPFFFNWPRHARAEAASFHPDVTIMFIGANDGFPFGSTPCCGRAWQRKYANVASGMMSTYARYGTVYWCLLPAPRGSDFRRVFVAVNAALKLAQRRHRGAVHLLDLPATFTPGYRFRQSITWQGRSVSVRQDDGVHLNVAGASIAASLMVRRMARDGVL